MPPKSWRVFLPNILTSSLFQIITQPHDSSSFSGIFAEVDQAIKLKSHHVDAAPRFSGMSRCRSSPFLPISEKRIEGKDGWLSISRSTEFLSGKFQEAPTEIKSDSESGFSISNEKPHLHPASPETSSQVHPFKKKEEGETATPSCKTDVVSRGFQPTSAEDLGTEVPTKAGFGKKSLTAISQPVRESLQSYRYPNSVKNRSTRTTKIPWDEHDDAIFRQVSIIASLNCRLDHIACGRSNGHVADELSELETVLKDLVEKLDNSRYTGLQKAESLIKVRKNTFFTELCIKLAFHIQPISLTFLHRTSTTA